jgi:hypothetical protein
MLATQLWYANRLPARNYLPGTPQQLDDRATRRANGPETISGKKARMEAENTWIVVWVALHIAALAAAYGTRVAAGSCLEGLTQVVFYAAMLMMALAIWACQQVHAGAWGLSAVTLIAMVLTAVVDFRKLGEHRSMSQMY